MTRNWMCLITHFDCAWCLIANGIKVTQFILNWLHVWLKIQAQIRVLHEILKVICYYKWYEIHTLSIEWFHLNVIELIRTVVKKQQPTISEILDVVSTKVTFLIEFISSLFCADIFTRFFKLTSCSLWFSNAPKHETN